MKEECSSNSLTEEENEKNDKRKNVINLCMCACVRLYSYDLYIRKWGIRGMVSKSLWLNRSTI